MKLSGAQLRPTEPDCARTPPDSACDVRTFTVERDGSVRGATSEEAAQLAASIDQGPNDFEPIPPALRQDGAAATTAPVDPKLAGASRPLRRVVVPKLKARCEARATQLECT